MIVDDRGEAPQANLVSGDFDAIFKANDIRGLVPEQFNEGMAWAIGSAFARFVKQVGGGERGEVGAHSILVGRDMRPDSVDLADAFIQGAISENVDVLDVGLCSTDMLYFGSGAYEMAGAVFTASHNPAGYNGIKMCGAMAAPIGTNSGLAEIKEVAIQVAAQATANADLTSETDRQIGKRTPIDLLEDYVRHALKFINVANLTPLKVVVDTANGMGGLIVPPVFAKLPLHLDHLYGDLDGTFPNHPADPIQPANMADLSERVVATRADIGIAFDGDADRVFFVDENGSLVSGSAIAALLARSVLAHEPGATIVHNLICSKSVPEIIAEHEGIAIRTRVGHSFIKEEIARTNAAFGAEHSGHYYFRDNFGADSGLIAALVVLEALSQHRKGFADLVSGVDRYVASGEINTKVADIDAVIEEVAREFAQHKQDRLDGLTVELDDWWFNLRPSNTEPLLRLNLEAKTIAKLEHHTQQMLLLLSNVGRSGAGAGAGLAEAS